MNLKLNFGNKDDSKAHVARCARVCYGRETGNDEATIKRLINDGHWSMFRHGTYYMIANDSDKTLETIWQIFIILLLNLKIYFLS